MASRVPSRARVGLGFAVWAAVFAFHSMACAAEPDRVTGGFVRLYRLAAEGGSARAQESLGELYEFGQAVQTDYQEAARWYRKAIEGGDALSASQLATMFFEGKGGTRDLPEAIRLWSWAAQQGEPRAQFNLAEVYMKGVGVSKDLRKSISLFTQAAKRFDVSKQLKEIYSQMEKEETAELH